MSKRLFICLAIVLGVAATVRSDDRPVSEEKPVDEWISALKDKDAPTRVRAALALGRMGTKAKAAVPALQEALKDENSSVRGRAAVALWRIDRPLKVVLPGLLAARHDPEESVRSE